MIDNIEVGRTIARLRQNRGMTQQQLAAALNVSHQAVSKWENGAALPDVQTLLNLTGLFGITVEQLLNGEVPEDKVECDIRSSLEDTLQNVGSAVNSFVNGLFAGAKKDDAVAGEEEMPEAEPADDEAPDAGAETDATAEPDTETEQAVESGDAAGPQPEQEPEKLDLDNLLRMAPFMTKQAVGDLLLEHKKELTSNDVAKFAPFITRERLEQLIQNPGSEINWDTLRRIAPFLKREMVDRLTWVAAKGEKFVRDAADQAGRSPEEIGRSLGEMSQRIGAGMEKALRRAAKLGEDAMNEAGKAIGDMLEGLKTREDRAAALRKAALERALQEGKWDWIAEHLDDADEQTRRDIAEKANAAGMHDWVLEHLNEDYADVASVENAIREERWDWLGEHVWQFAPELQQRTALAAAENGHWLWLQAYAEILQLEDTASEVVSAAYAAKQRDLALTLAEAGNADARKALADAAAQAGDDDMLDRLAPELEGYLDDLCLARAKEGNWDGALRFAAQLDVQTVEELTEQAIATGNFNAIDQLNPYL